MAYTDTDLTNIQTAIMALATGTRVVSLSIGGKTIQYGQAQLNELKALRDEIKSEVNSTAGRAQYVLTSTDKGL